MNITVTGRHIAVTDALRDYATEKLEAATNVFAIPMDVEVVLRVEKNPSNPVPDVVEVTVRMKNAVVRVSEAATDMYAAIDLAADRVSRQLRKYKTRVVDRRQRPGGEGRKAVASDQLADVAPAPQEDAGAQEVEEPEDELLVREKLIEFTPLTEDQALLQVDLLGHDFFVYTNAETGDVNVMYRRKSGGYGVIKPVAPAPAMGE